MCRTFNATDRRSQKRIPSMTAKPTATIPNRMAGSSALADPKTIARTATAPMAPVTTPSLMKLGSGSSGSTSGAVSARIASCSTVTRL